MPCDIRMEQYAANILILMCWVAAWMSIFGPKSLVLLLLLIISCFLFDLVASDIFVTLFMY